MGVGIMIFAALWALWSAPSKLSGTPWSVVLIYTAWVLSVAIMVGAAVVAEALL